jgi:hypothetical protein
MLVRRLGMCYGETAAASERRRNVRARLSFASYDPCAQQWLPELSRKGARASGESNLTDVGLRGLPALTSKRYRYLYS